MRAGGRGLLRAARSPGDGGGAGRGAVAGGGHAELLDARAGSGTSGPHRPQHLLSRARFDHERARRGIAGLVIDELAGQSVVLIADEAGDAKLSTDCVGAGWQYSGAIGGVGLCQVAVHLAAVTATTKVITDRALYLQADWAADEERREVAGVPKEITFATKPQQALAMVTDALAAGRKAVPPCDQHTRPGLLLVAVLVGSAAPVATQTAPPPHHHPVRPP
ncbi:transposase [Streptomyces sp. 184]|uniref:transposase n=1 Tax=Streptomyces sp. 184 TaxID=1827526 RepID=UPI003892B7EF